MTKYCKCCKKSTYHKKRIVSNWVDTYCNKCKTTKYYN